jgi:glucose/arabinose dehydrogenase
VLGFKVGEQAVRASASTKDRYAEINDRIVRYSLPSDSIGPSGPADTVISGLPLVGDHPMHPFIINAEGSMYVDLGTATNACQLKNRTPKSPGADPCTELETRGGIWRYDATKTNQTFSPGERFATEIRNAEGFAIDSSSRMFELTFLYPAPQSLRLVQFTLRDSFAEAS